MAFFNKGGDVLDFTLLQKRGLLKIKEDTTPDVIDLTQQNTGIVDNPVIPITNEQSISPGTSPFDMLNSLASVSSSSLTNTESPSSFGTGSDLKSNSDFSSLNVRVENLEYKIERLLEKISLVESKLMNL